MWPGDFINCGLYCEHDIGLVAFTCATRRLRDKISMSGGIKPVTISVVSICAKIVAGPGVYEKREMECSNLNVYRAREKQEQRLYLAVIFLEVIRRF